MDPATPPPPAAPGPARPGSPPVAPAPQVAPPAPPVAPTAAPPVLDRRPTAVSTAAPKKAETTMSDDTTVLPPDYKGIYVKDGDRSRGDRHGDDWYRPAERVKDEVQSSLLQVLERISQTVVAVEKNGRSAELATEKTGAATQLSVEKTSAAVAQAQAANFANTQNMLVTGFKDGRFDSSQATASILHGQVEGFKDTRYDACQNTAAIMAAMAKCCCELKEAIHAEGTDTRDLINSVDARRADRELVDAKNETAMLKLQLSNLSGVPVARGS